MLFVKMILKKKSLKSLSTFSLISLFVKINIHKAPPKSSASSAKNPNNANSTKLRINYACTRRKTTAYAMLTEIKMQAYFGSCGVRYD